MQGVCTKVSSISCLSVPTISNRSYISIPKPTFVNHRLLKRLFTFPRGLPIVLQLHEDFLSSIITSLKSLKNMQYIYLCYFTQRVNFTSPFYAPPVVLTTVINDGSNNNGYVSPLKDPMNSWLEVRFKTFTIRISDFPFKTANGLNRLVKGLKQLLRLHVLY